MSFLPPDYEAPQSGNYMKLQIGENRFRVLGPAIVGNMFWTTDGNGGRRPVRRRMNEQIHDDELGTDNNGKPERVRHFWAFPVWNVQTHQVQVLEITQRTIQEAILALNESPDWGDPTGYDLIIRKSGSGLDTEYHVMPGKPEPLSPDAQREFVKSSIDMNALYRGDDPFGGSAAGEQPQTVAREVVDGRQTITLNEAITLCKSVGIDKDTLVAHLKNKGLTAWNNAKCTPIVEALIAEQRKVTEPIQGDDNQSFEDDEIIPI